MDTQEIQQTADIMEATTECQICFEKYNNSNHKKVSCEYGDCSNSACKACIRTYLLNTVNDPHCMECKKIWTEQFIVTHLNRSFITSDYKTHRKTLLLEREISKMPETMAAANKYKRIEDQRKITETILNKIKEVKRLSERLTQEYNESNRLTALLVTGRVKEPEERRKFIMPCPNNDCRGYLSTQYKCDLCKLFTCHECHELIGLTKDDPHECKEENKQSAELIRKETKPCPTCGTRISKISGCDQMWCPECHKAFSWNTGLVDNGVIHNPHFYQYQRDNAGANDPPRNPGDIVCGGLCHWQELNGFVIKKIRGGTVMPGNTTEPAKDLRILLSDLHRFIQHITNVDLVHVRNKVRDLSDFEEVRCKYILKHISKDELARYIYQNDFLRKKLTEMLHIYELFSVVGIETFAKLIDSKNTGEEFAAECIQNIEEYNKLREYCNKQFKTISLTYNQTVPCVNKSWVINSKKYIMTAKKVKTEVVA